MHFSKADMIILPRESENNLRLPHLTYPAEIWEQIILWRFFTSVAKTDVSPLARLMEATWAKHVLQENNLGKAQQCNK